MTTGLVLAGFSARHPRGPDVVHAVDLTATRGSVTALIGPNGAGKSTLLKAILGLVPSSGNAHLDGTALHTLTAVERAQRMAYVPQRSQLTARLSVQSVVELGRFAHRGAWGARSPDDLQAVSKALADTGTTELAARPFPELSGGEQQRVLLARALASGATTLLLDEPTSALDVRQVLLLHQVLRHLADRGCCVLTVLHDLAEVRRHADAAVLLQAGRIAEAGPVEHVVAAGPVRAVYGVEVHSGGGLRFSLPEAEVP